MDHQTDDEHISFALETWKMTIEVQQHFNDLELRIRNFAITVLVAIFGAVGLTLSKPEFLSAFGLKTSSTVMLLIAGLIAWLAFYVMDRWWYHLMLRGAVQHAATIEAKLKNKVPGIELTTSINKANKIYIFDKWSFGASRRIDFFYGVVSIFLILAIIIFWISG